MKLLAASFRLFASLGLLLTLAGHPLALAHRPLNPPSWIETLKLEQPAVVSRNAAAASDLPDWIQAARLDAPLTIAAALDGLAGQPAPERILVLAQLSAPALAALIAAPEALPTRAADIQNAQDRLLESLVVAAPGSTLLARLSRSLNAVVLETDTAGLQWLAGQPEVIRLLPLTDYSLAGSPAPGAGSVFVSPPGNAGSGVKIAVFDSGIDFTHAKLGGRGTTTAYAAAYCGRPDARPDPADPTCNAHTQPPQFNAKVVGGYDFVGENWPLGPLAPDPNPIDFFGQGTQVADIAAGLPLRSPERARLRMAHLALSAPAVDVWLAGERLHADVAFRSVSEYAVLQPGAYHLRLTPAGQTQPVLAEASVLAEPGQDYTLAALEAPGAIALWLLPDDASAPTAQNAHLRFVHAAPEARAIDIALANGGPVLVSNLPYGQASDYLTLPAGSHTFEVRDTDTSALLLTLPAETLDGAHIYTGYALGRAGGSGSAAFGVLWSVDNLGAESGVAPGAELVAVKVCSAIVARCSGVALLQGLEFALDPNGDGDLSDRVDVINLSLGRPYGLAYDEALSMAILGAGSAGVLVVGAAGESGDKPYSVNTPGASFGALSVAATSAAGNVLTASARGPNGGTMFYNNELMYAQLIKPEIVAPGVAEAAHAGSGTRTHTLSGTATATARVSGAAAVLIHATNRQLWQTEIKSRLMNTADPRVFADGGQLAPITRVGSGELRLERALSAQAVAWEEHNRGGALSFGFVDAASDTVTLTRRVWVRNLSDRPIHFRIASSFRFPADELRGAVQLEVDDWLEVPPGVACPLEIKLHIDGSRLSGWYLNSGANGANGVALTALEFDGYLELTDDADPRNNLSLPWHVLPRRAADVEPATTTLFLEDGRDEMDVFNHGVGPAYLDAYSLVAISENQAAEFAGRDRTVIDLKAVGVRTFPVTAGFCSPASSYLLAFAISTYYRQSHANAPGRFEINLDLDRDGRHDYQVFNADLNWPNVADGRNVVWVRNLATGIATARFFTEHALESSNFGLVICAEQLGLTTASYGQPIHMRVEARDWANSGAVTDAVDDIVITPGGDRFLATGSDIAPGSSARWTVTDQGETGTHPSEFGLLLFTDAPRLENGQPARSGAADPQRDAWVIRVVP